MKTIYITTRVGKFQVDIQTHTPDKMIVVFNPYYHGGIRIISIKKAEYIYGSINKAIGSIIAEEVASLS